MNSAVVVRIGMAAIALTGCAEDPVSARAAGAIPPALWLWVAERQVSMAPGDVRTIRVAVGRAGGFTGAVTISLTNPPAGVSAEPVVLGPGVAAAEIAIHAAPTVALAAHTLSFQAAGSGVAAQTTTLTLSLVGYTLQVLPATILVGKGTRGTARVVVLRKGAFDGAVTLSATGAPSGVALTFEPADGDHHVRIDVASDAGAGSHAISIAGTPANGSAQPVTLTVIVPQLNPDFTLSLAPSAIAVGRGTQGAAQIRVDHRHGVLSDLTLSATGAPPGVSVGFEPVMQGNSDVTAFTARFGVDLLAAPGRFPVEIRVAGANGLAHSTTVDLTVTSSIAAGNTMVRFCPTAIPLWFAFQDGDGPWESVVGSGDAYRFNVSSDRGAVAWVLRGTYAGTFSTVVYGSRTELNTAAGVVCQELPPTGTKTLYGTVAGISSGEFAEVGFQPYSFPSWEGARFTLRNVASGPVDLIASQVVWDDGPRMTAGIIRRDLQPANHSTMPVLDFSSGEAFEAATRTLTIAKAADEVVNLSVLYRTARGAISNLSYEDPYEGLGSTSAQRRYGAHPNPPAGELQILYLATPSETRWLWLCFRDAIDRSVVFPPPFGPVAVSPVSSSANLRLRVGRAMQPHYPAGLSLQASQQDNEGGIHLSLRVTEAYQRGAAQVDLTSPDLAGLAGWNASWGLQPGRNVSWHASPGAGSQTQTACVDGFQTSGGSVDGVIP